MSRTYDAGSQHKARALRDRRSLAKAGGIQSDGTRVYFNEGPSGSFRVAQVSVNGGQTGEIATDLVNAQIAGLTGDAANLLVLVGAPVPTRQRMWSLPLPVGQARRLGENDVTDATVFPDGRLLYAVDTALFASDGDGSGAHKLPMTASIYDSIPAVSADGRRLVFSDSNTSAHGWVINQATSDCTGIRPMLSSGQGLPSRVSIPQWTPDGRHVIFLGQASGRWDLWMVPSSEGFLHRASPPTRLTNGPISYEPFAVSRAGEKIFAIGSLRRGELVRYDLSKREFVPYLGGISAYDVTFSKDGKWIAYLSYPEHTLWRCRADGSDRRQLTFPPMVAVFPRISPDGAKSPSPARAGRIWCAWMAVRLRKSGTIPLWLRTGPLTETFWRLPLGLSQVSRLPRELGARGSSMFARATPRLCLTRREQWAPGLRRRTL